MGVAGEKRSDRTRLHHFAPALDARSGQIFPDLEWIVMLENDNALAARQRRVHFVTEPEDLLVTQSKRPILHRVQTNEAIVIDRECVIGRTKVRLVGVTARVMVRIMVAD